MLEGAVLRGCSFTECAFVGCNLNRVDLVGSRFTDCTFVDCTALAVTWTRAAPAPLSARPWDFERCRLDLASFQEGALAGSRLVDCSLREADFGGADAQGVDFGGSGLAGAVFVGTDLRAASLLGASGYVFDPSENRVAGCASTGWGPPGCSSRWGSSSSRRRSTFLSRPCSAPVRDVRVDVLVDPRTSRENPRPALSPSRCSTCTHTPVSTSRATRYALAYTVAGRSPRSGRPPASASISSLTRPNSSGQHEHRGS